jgi:hypothetical protein
VAPAVSLASCERSEKERIVLVDAYSVAICFSLLDTVESEWHCYSYAAAVTKALGEDPTLGGTVDRAVITGKKYIQPKKPNCGEGWGLVLFLRVTVEQRTMNSEK